jgi:hypothetical protein
MTVGPSYSRNAWKHKRFAAGKLKNSWKSSADSQKRGVPV